MNANFQEDKLLLIHGLEGSSQGDKAIMLRSKFPRMLTPDFRGSLENRMQLLYSLLGKESGWTLIGSSLGGLMAALFCVQYPEQLRRLVLLAPALFVSDFSRERWHKVAVPTVIFQGAFDTIVPPAQTRSLAEAVFTDVEFHLVEDDHRLFNTVQKINWEGLLLGK